MHNRELMLNSAAEIHCFNKDVQDLLRRINEKELAFSGIEKSIGKDVHSCESLQRKHEIYIEELTALKVQLQDLNKQSEILRERHPGDTAESVAAETDELIDRFRELWLKAEKRTYELKQASDYFQFLACVKNVSEWMSRTSELIREHPASVDLFSVTRQKEEHENLSLEMTQRDDVFKYLDEMCIRLTAKQMHPKKFEILNQTNKVMTDRENLFRLWKIKSELLDSQYELQGFYKEVGQLVSLLSSQENLLSKAFGDSAAQLDQGVFLRVEDIEAMVKKQENLEKKIDKQAIDKTDELYKMGTLLLTKEKQRSVLSDQVEFKVNLFIKPSYHDFIEVNGKVIFIYFLISRETS